MGAQYNGNLSYLWTQWQPNCTASILVRVSGGKPGTQATKMIIARSSPFTQTQVLVLGQRA
jgi:hypothetical protein